MKKEISLCKEPLFWKMCVLHIISTSGIISNFFFFLSKALDSDRTILQKMKKTAKAKHISGQGMFNALFNGNVLDFHYFSRL